MNNGVRNLKRKSIFSKEYTKNCSKEIFFIGSGLKNSPWTYEIKKLKGEKIGKSKKENRK